MATGWCSQAAIIAVGVNAEGQREILGLQLGLSEAETFWSDFLRKLKRRGLNGVQLGYLRCPSRRQQTHDPIPERFWALPGNAAACTSCGTA